MYTYSLPQWLAFFYLYCFFGWIFESSYVSLKEHRFVNRGFLRLPMLPLYGSGAVMMLWVSLPVQDNLFLVYISGVIAATALEYVTGYVMERLFKVRYWDYSNQKFQIHGYICLSSSIAWGFLTIFMTEIIHQPVSELVLSIPSYSLNLSLILLTALFAADAYESTKEALALGQALEAMTKMKEEIEEIQAKILVLKEEAADHASLVRAEAVHRLYEMKLEAEEKLSAAKEETREHLEEIRENTKERLSQLTLQLEDAQKRRKALHSGTGLRRFYRKGLLQGNPGAASSRFSEALKELRDMLEQGE